MKNVLQGKCTEVQSMTKKELLKKPNPNRIVRLSKDRWKLIKTQDFLLQWLLSIDLEFCVIFIFIIFHVNCADIYKYKLTIVIYKPLIPGLQLPGTSVHYFKSDSNQPHICCLLLFLMDAANTGYHMFCSEHFCILYSTPTCFWSYYRSTGFTHAIAI